MADCWGGALGKTCGCAPNSLCGGRYVECKRRLDVGDRRCNRCSLMSIRVADVDLTRSRIKTGEACLAIFPRPQSAVKAWCGVGSCELTHLLIQVQTQTTAQGCPPRRDMKSVAEPQPMGDANCITVTFPAVLPRSGGPFRDKHWLTPRRCYITVGPTRTVQKTHLGVYY